MISEVLKAAEQMSAQFAAAGLTIGRKQTLSPEQLETYRALTHRRKELRAMSELARRPRVRAES